MNDLDQVHRIWLARGEAIGRILRKSLASGSALAGRVPTLLDWLRPRARPAVPHPG